LGSRDGLPESPGITAEQRTPKLDIGDIAGGFMAPRFAATGRYPPIADAAPIAVAIIVIFDLPSAKDLHPS
jgi:hypothetical protein